MRELVWMGNRGRTRLPDSESLRAEMVRSLNALRATQTRLRAECAALNRLLKRLTEQARIAAELEQADLVKDVRTRQAHVSERIDALSAQLAGITGELAKAEESLTLIDRHKITESRERIQDTILEVATQTMRMAEMEQAAAERLLEAQSRVQALEELTGLSAPLDLMPGDGRNRLRKLALEAELVRLREEIQTQEEV